MNEETMECPVCQVRKPETEFPLRNGKRRKCYCKQCFRRKYNDPYYAKNKERYQRNNKRLLGERQSMIFEYLQGHPCVDCGEADPLVLEFDHVRGVKSGNISQMMAYCVSEARLLEEIAKCEVRCANCHRRVTAIRGGWYRVKIQMGRANVLSRASNTRNEGETPSAPAIFIDDETGREVSADWWPGDPSETT